MRHPGAIATQSSGEAPRSYMLSLRRENRRGNVFRGVSMRRIAAIAAIITTGALLSGCTATGGGWVGTGASNSKVTFGISFTCTATFPGAGSGTMSYIDRRPSKTVSVTIAAGGACSQGSQVIDGTLAEYTGSYAARPKGTSGTATVVFLDTHAKGPSKGDQVHVTLTGGAYDGYDSGSMTLGGGNITLAN